MVFEEKPRKVHLYKDQKGATYRSRGKDRPFANTLCRGNHIPEGVITTTDPARVTCKRCQTSLGLLAEKLPEGMVDHTGNTIRELEAALKSAREDAARLARVLRMVRQHCRDETLFVVVLPQSMISVGDIVDGALALHDANARFNDEWG